MWDDAEVQTLVSMPKTLSEALTLLSANPQARLWAGGTSLVQPGQARYSVDRQIVSLHQIEDLRRVGVGERFLDLGTGLTLNQVLLQTRGQLPALLRLALERLGSWSHRNLATLGGNLGLGLAGDLFPVLQALGALVEVRSLRQGRTRSEWLPLEERLWNPRPPGLFTRIRLPREEWPGCHYEKLGHWGLPAAERLSLSFLLRVHRQSVAGLRLVYFLPGVGLVRSRSAEASLTGQRWPLSRPEIEDYAHRLLADAQTLNPGPSEFQNARLQELTRWLLNRPGSWD